MYFCKKCANAQAVVYNFKCEKCGQLKKSEIVISRDYFIWIWGKSTLAKGANISQIGTYDMAKIK